MKNRNQLLAALAAGLMAWPLAATAQYDYLSIDHPGGQETRVFGINDRGDVVGNSITQPDTFPFIYSPKKATFTNVAPLAGFDNTSVRGINNRGEMVGWVFSQETNKRSGFIRDPEGNFTVFDHPDAPSSTSARGINNKGLVTGFRDHPNVDVLTVGFIYDAETGIFTDLIPESVFTIVQGATSKGDIVGSSVFPPADNPCVEEPSETMRYGWVRTTDGNVTYFSVNGLETSARGITDSGAVAGFVYYPLTRIGKGFVTELDGTQCQMITIADEDLLVFPGAFFTIAHGVTHSGAIVGWYEDGSGRHGFIATPQ